MQPAQEFGKRVRRGHSPGQAVVEAALSFTFLVTLLLGVVSVGQLINYNISLENAAATAADAASIQADSTNGTPSPAAVSAVNQEQGVSSWSACGSPVVAPCVAVATISHSTGSSTTVSEEQVILHGTFTPLFSLMGVTLPVTATAAASK
jgi:Flp pilus assembly protein TadG